MSVVSPWFVLGVPENSAPSVVRAAWRAKVREFHPDGNGHGDVERFLAAQSAYRELSSIEDTPAAPSREPEPMVSTPPPSPSRPTQPAPPPTPDPEPVRQTPTSQPAPEPVTDDLAERLYEATDGDNLTSHHGEDDPSARLVVTASVVAVVVFVVARLLSVRLSPLVVDIPTVAVVALAAVAVLAAASLSRRRQDVRIVAAISAITGAAFGAWELALAGAVPVAAVAALVVAARHDPTADEVG